MTLFKTPLVIALGGTLTLAGCVDVTTGEPNRTRNGALIGAGIGAAAGAITGEGSRRDEILIGAAVGGLAGGAIGANLDRQAADLRRQLGDDRILITNTGNELIVTLPQDILFDTDSAALRADLQADIRALGRNLNQYPNTRVQVIGHTDSQGSAAYNQDLSERRARAVTNILLQQGVAGNRVIPIGRGESQPVASNNTAEGRRQNRRVEVIITPTR
ncbi:OmpA family protein [Jannaschia helgolandensis]|jgi:outer membrane protein OmpA-like peptidoglycan-associated protein|uniref:OmpA family protein n=1 Tax=Jannaschia helgolandensis TaxID=188906 RepID=UPI0030D9E15C|tara:strand:- start:942 stop:1592 length:651 start_codon:yes stop_codon:yes gene_type:complete